MRKNLFKLVLASVAVLIVLTGFGYVFRKSLLSLAANSADYVLRPLIGSANTLRIEAVLFSLEDKVNQVRSQAPTSADAVFNSDTSGDASQLATKMNLAPVTPPTHLNPFPKEGVWAPLFLKQFPKQILFAKTLVHVDDQRPYAYVALVKIDMSQVRIGTVAGTKQPGGPIGNPGEGKVPEAIKASNFLLAAFDGGFQYRDGAYGMIVGNKTYVPLRSQLATMFINNEGKADITEYDGTTIPTHTEAIRQNGPLLIKDGQVTSFNETSRDTWGRTITTSMYTWRSAIGQTKDGDLIYAVGPSLRPHTLALALQAAGAVNAMQLDINPFWVRFVLFQAQGGGSYQSYSLLKNMENGGASYLNGYQKDFFYIYAQTQKK